MRPLQSLSSLKLKLGIVIVAAVWVTAVATIIAVRWLGLPSLVGAGAGIAIALACVQLLARGTTKPLREMAAVATAMARGERGRQVAVTSNDEVGELARAFNRMTAELAETDRLRRDLVANVSHELRTPLGALQAVLENVVDGVSEADPETLRTMLAQTRRLGRLVTQLLDLSRLEAGEQPFDIRPFAIRDVLDSAAREARLHAPEDVVFSIDAPAGLHAEGDSERIHQVVMNLVENAVRYSPRPGHVALRASRAADAVMLEVDDEGPGIAEDDLEHVFERFYRGDARERIARRWRRRRPGSGDRALDRRSARRHDPRRAPRPARQPHGRHAPARELVDERLPWGSMRLALALIAAASIVASGCGEQRGDAASTVPQPVGPPPGVGTKVVATAAVALVEYALESRDSRLRRAGRIAFEATNDGRRRVMRSRSTDRRDRSARARCAPASARRSPCSCRPGRTSGIARSATTSSAGWSGACAWPSRSYSSS